MPFDAVPAATPKPHNDWAPFRDRVQFEFADLIYRRNQMPMSQINVVLELWQASMLLAHEDLTEENAPFSDAKDMLSTIDSIEVGDAPWMSFVCERSAELPEDAPDWMTHNYEVWYRDPVKTVENMLANPDFKDEFDFVPYLDYDKGNVRRYCDFFSGNWAWDQAVCAFESFPADIELLFLPQDIIARSPENIGSMFVPLILGNDKTTVSVATGGNEFYPVYLSLGNVHNNVRRAHRNAVVVIAFLAIPKGKLLSQHLCQPFR